MSLLLQGKALPFSIKDYAKSIGFQISTRSISGVKLLWITLIDFYNDETHQCNPSISTLARMIEKSTSQTTLHM
jgi:hypothetical protein